MISCFNLQRQANGLYPNSPDTQKLPSLKIEMAHLNPAGDKSVGSIFKGETIKPITPEFR